MHQQNEVVPGRPAVSVVMPLYNKANFVERAVDSVLSQVFTDFELIIVDDGSTDDGASRVARGYCDSRIQLIRQSNAGVGAARNRALHESRGELIAFLDADDEWQPNHLVDLVELAERFPSAGIFTSRIACKSGENLILDIAIESEKPVLIENYFHIKKQSRAWLNQSSTTAIRREVMLRLGGFLESTPYGEDVEYWARICLCYPMAFHPAVSSIYHIDVPGSAISMERWTAKEAPVVRTLRRYLAVQPDSGNHADVRDYAASIILQQVYNGIACGQSRAVNELLADEIVLQSRFKQRVRRLRAAAVVPGVLSRAFIRIARLAIRPILVRMRHPHVPYVKPDVQPERSKVLAGVR